MKYFLKSKIHFPLFSPEEFHLYFTSICNEFKCPRPHHFPNEKTKQKTFFILVSIHSLEHKIKNKKKKKKTLWINYHCSQIFRFRNDCVMQNHQNRKRSQHIERTWPLRRHHHFADATFWSLYTHLHLTLTLRQKSTVTQFHLNSLTEVAVILEWHADRRENGNANLYFIKSWYLGCEFGFNPSWTLYDWWNIVQIHIIFKVAVKNPS